MASPAEGLARLREAAESGELDATSTSAAAIGERIDTDPTRRLDMELLAG